jgi:hypothetical protein
VLLAALVASSSTPSTTHIQVESARFSLLKTTEEELGFASSKIFLQQLPLDQVRYRPLKNNTELGFHRYSQMAITA